MANFISIGRFHDHWLDAPCNCPACGKKQLCVNRCGPPCCRFNNRGDGERYWAGVLQEMLHWCKFSLQLSQLSASPCQIPCSGAENFWCTQVAVAVLAGVGAFYVLHILGFGTIYKVLIYLVSIFTPCWHVRLFLAAVVQRSLCWQTHHCHLGHLIQVTCV